MAGGAEPGGGADVKRVAVVGGGLAGIAAALDCAAAGAEVTVLESRGRLGGAAYSFTRNGILADNGQHVFLRCCTAYRELLQRIGADDLVTMQPRLSIPVLAPGGRTASLRRSGLPAPLHLAGALARAGVEIRLRRGATAIVPCADGFRVEISSSPTLAADAVILAVPHTRAGGLLPSGSGLDHTRLAQLGTSPIVNLHIAYDRRVLDVPFAAGVRTPVQWIFDRTESAGLTHGQFLAISLSAADVELEQTVDELRDRYLRALAELLPAARDAVAETFFVTREHAATFRAAPGARALRPGPHPAIPGLVLAGAWTDTGWPATMEGAVRSGRTAAQAALQAAARTPTSTPTAAVVG